MRQGEAQNKRRKWHITAANIKKPCDRSRIADHRCVILRLTQQCSDLIALFLGTSASVLQHMRHGLRERWGWPVGPYGVDWVPIHRHHREARIDVARQPVFADQHWVEADLRASHRIRR
jgi:hypothetical protein